MGPNCCIDCPQPLGLPLRSNLSYPLKRHSPTPTPLGQEPVGEGDHKLPASPRTQAWCPAAYSIADMVEPVLMFSLLVPPQAVSRHVMSTAGSSLRALGRARAVGSSFKLQRISQLGLGFCRTSRGASNKTQEGNNICFPPSADPYTPACWLVENYWWDPRLLGTAWEQPHPLKK